jgi:2C-methyl-D-erythritol 2,4-cyclodiphosphate synthase
MDKMSGYREGKSGVNVKRLVQNIAEQYSFEPQIAAIVELVANALDAKSSEIQIKLDKNAGILAIIDNGIGMDKRQFIEYHDFAATTKERGKGIGFAGQGAKLALNFCKKVITETWSSNYHGYSEWCLKGNDAPYKIFDGGKLDLDHLGTKVTLYLNKNSIDFYTEEVIENTIIEHYFPLIHCELREFYKNLFYKDGTKIFLNEKEIVMDKSFEELLEYKKNIIIKFRHNEVYGIIGQTKNGNAFLQDLQGIMICTFGKVIERTYFRKEPKNKERIIGWIEAPYLIEAVTTDKCRFQKGNKTWEGFFRKAQTEFSAWLEEIGLLESSIKREVEYTNIEKEINFILKNFPDLSFFGTTIKREVAIPDGNGEQRDMGEGTQKVKGTIGGDSQGGGLSVYPGEEHGEGPTLEKGEGSNATSKPRSIKGGIRITEDERPDVDKESWFDGETVAINKSHPAYKKAKLSGLLNYHILKTVILSIIEFNLDKGNISEPQKAFEIQQRFFKIWGEQ